MAKQVPVMKSVYALSGEYGCQLLVVEVEVGSAAAWRFYAGCGVARTSILGQDGYISSGSQLRSAKFSPAVCSFFEDYS